MAIRPFHTKISEMSFIFTSNLLAFLLLLNFADFGSACCCCDCCCCCNQQQTMTVNGTTIPMGGGGCGCGGGSSDSALLALLLGRRRRRRNISIAPSKELKRIGRSAGVGKNACKSAIVGENGPVRAEKVKRNGFRVFGPAEEELQQDRPQNPRFIAVHSSQLKMDNEKAMMRG